VRRAKTKRIDDKKDLIQVNMSKAVTQVQVENYGEEKCDVGALIRPVRINM